MADIRKDGSEVLHYDEPEVKIMYRKNFIPANTNLESDISIHWHEDIEILFVEQGHTFYKLNDRTVRMNAGEGIFVNSDQLHLIVPGDEDCVVHCLIFHPRVIGNNEFMFNKFVKPITCNNDCPYITLSENVDWQSQIYELVKNMDNYYFDCKTLKVYELLYKIWGLLYDNVKTENNDNDKPNINLDIVKKMIAYISINYANKISLSDICNAGNVGKTKGTALFSKFTNQTPIEYLNNFRLEKSFQLLINTDKPITEIAVEVGFSDSSYYTKSFKERMGCSPKDYRNNKYEN